jgi:drug/metabolite transporter (DMT)-like permease
MLFWCFAFTLNMSLAKLLNKNLSIIMIIFVRCFFGVMLFMPFVLNNGISYFKTSRLRLHVIRIILICGAMFCTYYAYTHLPISIATSISFTKPLIIVFLARIILKEKVLIKHWIAVIFGYLGILVVIRPSIISFSYGVISSIFANVFMSFAILTVKKLNETESRKTLILYNNTVILLFTGLLVLFSEFTITAKDLWLLLAMGITAIFSQYCYISALKIEKPSVLAPFEYTRLIFAIPIGYVLFNESITSWLLIGVIMIIISNYYVAHINKSVLEHGESRLKSVHV